MPSRVNDADYENRLKDHQAANPLFQHKDKRSLILPSFEHNSHIIKSLVSLSEAEKPYLAIPV